MSRAADLCQRNGATREDVERLWLRLLDCLLRWQRRLRQEGEPTVGEETSSLAAQHRPRAPERR